MTKKAKVLLVEDEVDVQRANRQYLAEQGYEVYCAETLKNARAILWEYSPDLILLDVMLPDGSGFDLCREIREYSTVPIIFLTAMGEDGNVVGGFSLGGDDYIVKPYSMEIMGARVAAQLRRHGAGSGIIELPPLRIDLASGDAWLDGKPLKLSPKELQLLAYLVEYRGRTLNQAQIYQDVWSAPPETMGNVVKLNMSRLRRKLNLDGEDSCFELISSRQGYRFLRVRYPAAK